MDPIANLKEQLQKARFIQKCADAGDDSITIDQAERLADLVIALDEWMRKGGFSPWQASNA